MSKSRETIIQEISTFISEKGGDYSSWYVGIASKPKERLFVDHNVKHRWTFREAKDADTAREAESYFVNVLGTDGGTGGGDYTTKYVYVYKKTSYTNE